MRPEIFKENVLWPLRNKCSVEDPTHQQAITKCPSPWGIQLWFPACSSPLGSSHIMQHDPDRESWREVCRGWAELLLLWWHKEEICSSVAACTRCFVSVVSKGHFLLCFSSRSLNLQYNEFSDALTLAGFHCHICDLSLWGWLCCWPERSEGTSMLMSPCCVWRRRATEQHCNPLQAGRDMAGVTTALERGVGRLFWGPFCLYLAGASDASFQLVPVLAPVLGTLLVLSEFKSHDCWSV